MKFKKSIAMAMSVLMAAGMHCRMRIKWQYIIKYCIRQCIICIGRGINRRSYDFYL